MSARSWSRSWWHSMKAHLLSQYRTRGDAYFSSECTWIKLRPIPRVVRCTHRCLCALESRRLCTMCAWVSDAQSDGFPHLPCHNRIGCNHREDNQSSSSTLIRVPQQCHPNDIYQLDSRSPTCVASRSPTSYISISKDPSPPTEVVLGKPWQNT